MGANVLQAQDTGPPLNELAVKAAFVLNFIRFVTWPQIAGENKNELPVCAIANSDFARAVRDAVTGRAVQSRTVTFHLDPDPDATRCRVLVVDWGQHQMARPILNVLRNASILTIGNGAGWTEMGGMFELIVENRNVLFDANLDAIRRADLHVSPRLLQLSRNLRKK